MSFATYINVTDWLVITYMSFPNTKNLNEWLFFVNYCVFSPFLKLPTNEIS